MWKEVYSLFFPEYKRRICAENAPAASSLSKQSVASVSGNPPSCCKHSSHIVTSKLTKTWWTGRLTGWWCWCLTRPSLHVCDRVVPDTNVSYESLVKLINYMKIALRSVWVDLQRVNTELFQGRRRSDWLASCSSIDLMTRSRRRVGWDTFTTFGFPWRLRSNSSQSSSWITSQ